VSEQVRRSAAARYAKAVKDLRAARARFVAAGVPMDLVSREPPAWTHEQRAAVLTYANAWMWLQWARESWDVPDGNAGPPAATPPEAGTSA
jgi:hypothetical protein